MWKYSKFAIYFQNIINVPFGSSKIWTLDQSSKPFNDLKTLCVSKHFRDFQWTWTKDKNRQKTKFSILITLSSSSWYCILSLLQNVFDKITARFDFSIHCLLFSSELDLKCHLGRNSDIKSKFVNGFLENLFLKQFE